LCVFAWRARCRKDVEFLENSQYECHFITVGAADDISLGRQRAIDQEVPYEPAISWIHEKAKAPLLHCGIFHLKLLTTFSHQQWPQISLVVAYFHFATPRSSSSIMRSVLFSIPLQKLRSASWIE